MVGFVGQRRSSPDYEDIRWTINDEDYLAGIVAVVALGQASHAATLIAALEPMAPAFSNDLLRSVAISKLEIQPGTQTEMVARRAHRDGLLFEVLSWIALVENHVGDRYLVRDPHLGATTQGLDGLLLEMDPGLNEVVRTIIIEDKCSKNPRSTFQSKVLPAFKGHHSNERAPDLVASASSLLGRLSDPTSAVKRAAAVLDISRRGYRAALALESGFDASDQRQDLFNGYDSLVGMDPANREGSGFVVGDDLRPWFEQFAGRVREALGRMDAGEIVRS